ncbi:N-acetylneuraminate synthase family protein [Roseospira visakhapatnamensis]|uniref:N-acetylneuraminate synthase n=1 Tax=Roseospira visakhapatnamensis TaxID=390880 RepID=A0A7W6WAR8_9PROT|nr:N-acetylneuraminate synthase family protein [Roseospira visakhapatnamensis]MBB4267470.1 N-acetylneuraminate synthase [Roseospira visakhapatnamensis]
MHITRHTAPYLVLDGTPLLQVLQKIDSNKCGVVFVVDTHGVLCGCLTDGDFRRFIVSAPNPALEAPVSQAMNRTFTAARVSDAGEYINSLFSDRILYVPLLDTQGRVQAIASSLQPPIRIGPFEVSDSAPTVVIAEIGNNHNGSLDSAIELINLAAGAGANCVKFQLRDLSTLYRDAGNDHDEDLGSQYVLDQVSRFQLSPDDLGRAFDHARKVGVLPFCTPSDERSVEILEGLGVEAYKIASADLVNHDLIRAVAALGKPVLLSTGMSLESEIVDAVAVLQQLPSPWVLLHCNAAYPPPFKDINLSFLSRLRTLGACPVGYSGHERGYHVPLAAVALGARVVEKHFTDDRAREGNDHRVSLLPAEFQAMVDAIRQLEDAMGDGVRRISQGEFINREALGKSLVAARAIAAGELIAADDVLVRCPGRGLPPYQKNRLVGRRAKRAVPAMAFFYPSDLEADRVALATYAFRRPWGFPVRYHDYRGLADISNPDLLEFHLSFKDMDLRLSDYLDQPLPLDLVVHAPEVFANDFLLDLASTDAATRDRSIDELQRVVDVCRALTPWFERATRPPIIVNVGGFSRDGFVDRAERDRRYDRVADALSRVDREGVEILPQTMPPFPWLFGGQLHHNLFLDAESSTAFCRATGLRLCLDTSHSKLACTYFGWSFDDFAATVLPFTRHMHLVDARGTDGEGLQIGTGEIAFDRLAALADDLAPGVSFIPEIWQGHKNDGEGFAIALERLQQWF